MKRLYQALMASVVLALGSATACASEDKTGIPDEPVADGGVDVTGDAPDAADAPSDSGGDAVDAPGDALEAICGNGDLEPPEECDDGNQVNGDGCDEDCLTEANGANDICPGVKLDMMPSALGRRGTVIATTATALHHYAANCGGGSGNDVVYSFSSDAAGKARVTLQAEYAAVLSVRETCSDVTSEVACSNLPDSTDALIVEFQVEKDKEYYLGVDGFGGESGPFSLEVDVIVAVCGNGLAEPPEECDDSNTADGDGCSMACEREAVGDLDACGATALPLIAGAPISLAGDTSLLSASTRARYCSSLNGGGGEAIYPVTPQVTGSLRAKLRPGYDLAQLHVREECPDPNTELDCADVPSAGGTGELRIPVFANRSVNVFVDGAASSGGAYVLDLELTAAMCSNGVLDGGEGCDDGNTTPGDGCSATCQIEPDPQADVCPGRTLTLSDAGGKLVATAIGSTDDSAKTSAFSMCGSALANDSVYTVTPPADGVMNVVVSGDFSRSVSVLTDCTDEGTQLACQPITGPGDVNFDVPVQAGVPVWVVVDGRSGSTAGTFLLTLSVDPPVCGNSAIEGAEQCDDGNTLGNDGCDPNCQLEPVTGRDTCATAEVLTLTDNGGGFFSSTLFTGSTNLSDTDTSCFGVGPDAWFKYTAPTTGVMRARAFLNSFNVTLSAFADCSSAPLKCSDLNFGSGLGNGEEVTVPVTMGQDVYLKMDGRLASDFGSFAIDLLHRPAGCGDGLTSPGEECDDANTDSGDGCSDMCELEALAGVDTCPGYSLALTPDGMQQRATLTLGTASLNASTAGSCGGNAPEGVVVVTPNVSGTLRASVQAEYNARLYARSSCSDTGTELGCSATAFEFAAVGGTPYYFFVDGFAGESGAARVDFRLIP